MSTTPLKIGTRASPLAMWQARTVAAKLQKSGVQSELVQIKTEGDLVLDTPLPLMGGKGVFTKALDDALLARTIDLAVHSHKDIPTVLPPGLMIGAVLKREDPRDVLVVREGLDFLEDEHYEAVIATSSTRRAGQWLNRYPQHKTADIRGNVQTRLDKLGKSTFDGAIFAAAGLKRLGLESRIASYLDWMIPAPAQGAVAVMVRDKDAVTQHAVRTLHHQTTALCNAMERTFLNLLGGGCSAPVGAYALPRSNGNIVFKASVLSTDGRQRFDVSLAGAPAEADYLARKAASEVLEAGAGALLRE